jgi:WXG100 family type VII secretion target
MADRVEIDFGRMEGLASSIGSANSTITSLLSHLDNEVSSLEGAWTGDASTAYTRAHKEWSASISELNRILGEVRTVTATITDRHRAAEQKVQKLWG